MEPKYIIWDPKDGDPRRGDDGEFISDGIIGRVTKDNVYIKTYPKYEKVSVSVSLLEVGEYVEAIYSLSGSKGRYRIYRVQ